MSKVINAIISKEDRDKNNQELEALSKKVPTKKYRNLDFERHKQSTIILPEKMSFGDAKEWIERAEHADQEEVLLERQMGCYPSDGAYALYRAVDTLFGFAAVRGEKSPSGDNPPEFKSIVLPDGSSIQVPWGDLPLPGVEDGFISQSYNYNRMIFQIRARIKRKYTALVERLFDLTEIILRDHSIYKGQAIRIDLSDGTGAEPTFINEEVSKINSENVVMSKAAESQYNNVRFRIRHTEEAVKMGLNLKHGAVLAGPYGTGKTLTAMLTAHDAIENGWTFIYLENVMDLARGLRLAERYAPAVIFAEDIDNATQGGRTSAVNDILNTLDGIDTKEKPIITVLTTNHSDRINKAFLRAGRIDTLVLMEEMDEYQAEKLLKLRSHDEKGNKIFHQNFSYKKAAKSLCGVVPAFGQSIIERARINAIVESGDPNRLILTDHIISAADAYQKHIKLVNETQDLTPEQKLADAVRLVGEYLGEGNMVLRRVKDYLSGVRSEVGELYDNLL
jgi:transitional endoplasmic reticulum ATPase